jgi:hypothetical protein
MGNMSTKVRHFRLSGQLCHYVAPGNSLNRIGIHHANFITVQQQVQEMDVVRSTVFQLEAAHTTMKQKCVYKLPSIIARQTAQHQV